MFKKHKKITGVQLSALNIYTPIQGSRSVSYAEGQIELTVDTDVGNRIIDEQELLDYINLKTLE